MLNKIREQATGFFAKVLLGLLVVSFAIWGIADIFRGYGTSALANVGSQEIQTEQYRHALNRELQQLSAQAKRPISMADAHSMGIDQQVLGQLVAEAALDQRTQDLGLALSDKAVAQNVMKDPTFHGQDGKFDKQRFLQILENAGFSEQGFVASQRAFLLRRQLLDALTGGVKTPPPLLAAIDRYQNESRNLLYVVLGPQAIPPVGDPDEKALQAFFDAHKAEFRTEERRSITALPVSVDILAPKESVTEDEITARYDQQKSKFTTPEKRTIERIVFKTMAEAETAAAKIKAGTSFADLAKERSLSEQDISLGTVTQADILDSALAKAAFSLPEGGVSQPIKGQFSPMLAHVTKIVPASTKPLSAVKDEVRHEVQLAKARDALTQVHDAIEDDRAGGATLAEIAAKRHLELAKIGDVNAEGRLPDGSKAPGPHLQELLSAAFQTVVDADNDPVRLDDTGYIWYNVTKVDPAHDRTLAQAKNDVIAAWRRDQVRQRLAAKSDEVVKALREGKTTLQQFASEVMSTVQQATGLTRVAQELPKAFGPGAVAAAFSTAEHGYGVADGAAAPERIVFQVSKVTVPKPDPGSPAAKAIGDRLDQALQNDLATQYVLDLQNSYGVRVNETALASVTGSSAGE